MISVEEFNRMMNINLKLLKILEEGYQPKKPVHEKRDYNDRLKMIEDLESRIRNLKHEMRSNVNNEVSVKRFY